ncbi:MAG: glutamate 5-kinase [Rhodospirillaceae bacterium]|nr:glutamate 5-kinase [Rhodospirillaceae bacterium]|tara:strand:+ start:4342 stop:5469 length:1128 start_codon:yes stop_codon:yes gene_type:complete
MSDNKNSLSSANRLIVKVGSALLTTDDAEGLNQDWLDALADDVATYVSNGTQVIIVSSGAVAVGRQALSLSETALRLEEKQAAAAAGQIGLFHAWQRAFARHDLQTAQILLTPSDTEERRRHLNARNTMETLLGLGAVPVINENDTVATEEIRFGDNDRLAARVAQMIGADTLALLSDIDGLYSADPKKDSDAQFIEEVSEITAAVEAMAGEAGPGYSSGGMVTKIEAAKIATRAGCAVVIADGKELHSLSNIESGKKCTWFLATANPSTARKRWIAGALTTSGALAIDDGARTALGSGKSLLPAGVTKVSGDFERGDAVIIEDASGNRLGCGLIAYSSNDAKLIAGHKTGEIEALLGYRGRDEMIHRDDLVIDG